MWLTATGCMESPPARNRSSRTLSAVLAEDEIRLPLVQWLMRPGATETLSLEQLLRRPAWMGRGSLPRDGSSRLLPRAGAIERPGEGGLPKLSRTAGVPRLRAGRGRPTSGHLGRYIAEGATASPDTSQLRHDKALGCNNTGVGFWETLARGGDPVNPPTPKPATPKPGWYSMQGEFGLVRYWDGKAWTDYVAPAVPVEQIGVYTAEPPVPYWEVRRLKVKVGSSLLTVGPTIEDVNMKLREQASSLGATAVIGVSYRRWATFFAWKGLYADGLAVVLKQLALTEASAASASNSADVEDRLGKLDELRDSGAITVVREDPINIMCRMKCEHRDKAGRLERQLPVLAQRRASCDNT